MKSRRRGKSGKLPPFVALTWRILNSQAYKDLPTSATKALPYFLGKVKCGYNDPQRYLGEFVFPYSEGKKFGFAFGTFSKVIQDLVRFGFIDPVDKGGLRGDSKSYNVFRLSKRWELYGTPGFESLEWRCFIPKPR
jgi:hypothetical protein